MSAGLLGGLILCLLQGGAQASPAQPAGLSDLVRLAAERSPEFLNARLSEEIQELELSSARAKFLPSLDLSATHGIKESAAPWFSQITLGLTETLYDNGESWTQYSIAKLKLELARLGSFKLREELTLKIAKEFYRYSLNHHLLEVRQQQKQMLEKQYASLLMQYQQGLKKKQDYLRLKAQLQRAILDLASAESGLSTSRIQLKSLVAKAVEDPEVERVEVVPVTTGKLAISQGSITMAQTYLARMSALDARITEHTADLSWRKVWPEAYLTSGVTYGYADYLNAPAGAELRATTDWNVLLTLKFNLWDWRARRSAGRVSDLKTLSKRNEIEAQLITLNARNETLTLELKQQAENLELYEDLLKMEEESYLRLSNDYREGRISYLDLVAGMDYLVNARVSYFRTYFGLLEQIAEVRSIEGTLYETITEK